MTATGAQELRIPLRHLKLAARAWGDSADAPILALHGWLDNAGTFDRLAPLLKGRYVVALDLAGHGRSGHRPPGNWYPYVDFLDDIGQVIDWFGWTSVDLLGHSLGATLVSVFAALCPDKVRRLLLIEGLGPLTLATEKTLDQLRRSHAARAAFKGSSLRVFPDLDAAIEARRAAGQLSVEAARCIVERGVRVVGAEGADADGGEGEANGTMAEEQENRDGDFDLERVKALPGFSWSSDPALTLPSPTRLSEAQLAVILPAIRMKTLLVLAEPEAPYLQRDVMQARIDLLSDIEVIRMAGSHHLHLEDPEPVAAAINRFLEMP